MHSIKWRPIVREALETLASEEEQLAYERNVPIADVSAELEIGWFEDSYYPDDGEFRACFLRHELNALDQFNRFFEERDSRLPNSEGTISTWLATPVWREIMRHAQLTLEQICEP